jgi:hypothetical protein
VKAKALGDGAARALPRCLFSVLVEELVIFGPLRAAVNTRGPFPHLGAAI